MDQKARMIEEQMRSARARLVEKLNALERRADRKIGQPAHEAVAAAESLKNSLSDAVGFVQGIPAKASQRPWLTLGLSVVAGYGAYRLLDKRLKTETSQRGLQVVPEAQVEPPKPVPASPASSEKPAANGSLSRAKQPPPRPSESSSGNGKDNRSAVAKIKDEVADALEEPLEELKGVAVDAARGFAWGLLSKALPDVFRAEQVRNVAPEVEPERRPQPANSEP